MIVIFMVGGVMGNGAVLFFTPGCEVFRARHEDTSGGSSPHGQVALSESARKKKGVRWQPCVGTSHMLINECNQTCQSTRIEQVIYRSGIPLKVRLR